VEPFLCFYLPVATVKEEEQQRFLHFSLHIRERRANDFSFLWSIENKSNVKGNEGNKVN